MGTARYADRTCLGCGTQFTPRQKNQGFHSRACRSRNYHRYHKSVMIVPCSVDGCDAVARACGLCCKHYRRHRLYGDTGYIACVSVHEIAVGSKFGRGAVTGWRRNSRGRKVWVLTCTCESRNEYEANAADLINERVKSCGCLRREMLAKRRRQARRHRDGDIVTLGGNEHVALTNADTGNRVYPLRARYEAEQMYGVDITPKDRVWWVDGQVVVAAKSKRICACLGCGEPVVYVLSAVNSLGGKMHRQCYDRMRVDGELPSIRRGKLSPAQALEMRLFAVCGITHTAIANAYGCSTQNVGLVVNGSTWKYLPIYSGENPNEFIVRAAKVRAGLLDREQRTECVSGGADHSPALE